MFWRYLLLFLLILGLIILGPPFYQRYITPSPQPPVVITPPITTPSKPPVLSPKTPSLSSPVTKLLNSVFKQSLVTRSYDPSYVVLKYPGGDVPEATGVCADVVVRAFRASGVDLQRLLHEDMQANFEAYPKKWGLKKPDSNIDHRRVYNLMRLFERQHKDVAISFDPQDYKPGDIVTWDLGQGQGHIGIVTQLRTDDGARPLIGHNVGYGTNIQDVLYAWPIIGHYRYFDQ